MNRLFRIALALGLLLIPLAFVPTLGAKAVLGMYVSGFALVFVVVVLLKIFPSKNKERGE